MKLLTLIIDDDIDNNEILEYFEEIIDEELPFDWLCQIKSLKQVDGDAAEWKQELK